MCATSHFREEILPSCQYVECQSLSSSLFLIRSLEFARRSVILYIYIYISGIPLRERFKRGTDRARARARSRRIESKYLRFHRGRSEKLGRARIVTTGRGSARLSLPSCSRGCSSRSRGPTRPRHWLRESSITIERDGRTRKRDRAALDGKRVLRVSLGYIRPKEDGEMHRGWRWRRLCVSSARFMAVSLQGPQDRCCDEIHRSGGETKGRKRANFRSLVSPCFLSPFLRSLFLPNRFSRQRRERSRDAITS